MSGRTKCPERLLADHLGVRPKVVKAMGGIERFARMTPDARAIMAGPALAQYFSERNLIRKPSMKFMGWRIFACRLKKA